MKRKILILIPLLALLSAAVYAGTNAYLIGVTGVVASSEEPAADTVLFGNDTEGGSSAAYRNAGAEGAEQVHYWATAFEADWEESASTTTLGAIEIYSKGRTSANCKAWLVNTSYQLVANSVTDVVAYTYSETPTWHSYGYSGTGPTITKGASYAMMVVCDTDYAIDLYYDTGGSTWYCRQTNDGAYETPLGINYTTGQCNSANTTSGTPVSWRGVK